jgi:hypothetical protein
VAEKQHIEMALRVCAEAGVPENPVPWGEIRERALAARRPSSPRWRFVPRTRAGLAFAVLLVMLFGTVGFAATGWIDEILQENAPEIVEDNLGVPLDKEQSVDGLSFTLERAYADEDNVMVGYSIEGFDDWNEGYRATGMAKITDGSGRTFEYVGGLGMGTGGPGHNPEDGERLTDLAFFEPSEKLGTSPGHRFRLEMKLNPNIDGGEGSPGSVAYDFEVPVHELKVIEVGQTVEAGGVPITLQRVENSPARTGATLRFDPPRDGVRAWVPIVGRPNTSQSDVFSNEWLYLEKPAKTTGCVEYDLFRSLHDDPGRHVITVTELQGRSGTKTNPDETIEGPWTFEFEVPER